MLDPVVHEQIAQELLRAERERSMVPLLTNRYDGMTVEDSYAVQRLWHRRGVQEGRPTIPPPASPGWRTSSLSTATVSRPAKSFFRAASPARCGSAAAT